MSKASRKRVISQVEKSSDTQAKISKPRAKQVKQSKPKQESKPIPELDEIDIFEHLNSKDYKQGPLLEALEEKSLEYPDKVMEDIVVLILKALGYPEVSVNIEVGRDLEVDGDEILKTIYSIDSKKNVNSFPLMVKKRELKKFKTLYLSFWTHLITKSDNTVFQTKILEGLIKLLVTFSKSKLRTIRYGSAETLAAISSPLLDMMVNLNDEQKRQEARLQTITQENRKEEMKEYKKNDEEIKKKVKRLSKLIDTIMKEFLKKRFEDAMPEIRLKVLELLTQVVKKIPRLGSDASLIAIINTLLNGDTEPLITKACLDFVEQITQPREGEALNKANLKNLKKDLFDLCFNSNTTIAAKAFKIIKLHISSFELKSSDIEQLYHLVFYDDEGVASLAADFINTMVFNDELLNDSTDNEEFIFLKDQDDSREQLLKMARLYDSISSEEVLDEKVEKFVSAFFKKTQILFDFQGMIALVTEKAQPKRGKGKEEALSQKEKKILLKFMHSSVKVCKALTASALPHEKTFKAYIERTLTHISEVIKYRAQEVLTVLKLDEDLLTSLLPVFEEVDLETFFSEDNTEHYQAFLSVLEDVFDISQNPRVCERIMKLYAKLKDFPSIEEEVSEIMKRSSTLMIKTFREKFENYDLVIEEQGNPITEGILLESLMKLHKISVYFISEEITQDSFIEEISKALDIFLSKNSVPTEFAVHAINILFYIHFWRVRNLLTKAEITEEDCLEYIKLRAKIIDKFLACFMIDDLLKKFGIEDTDKQAEARNKLLGLQETAYTLIIETLCVVSSDRFVRVPFLFYQPSVELLSSLEAYILTLDTKEPTTELKLFNSSSKRLVEGLRKSNMLAKDDEDGSEKSEDEEEKEIDEDDEDGEKGPGVLRKHENGGKTPKKKVVNHREVQKMDERLHFSYSLLIKLFMQSSRLLTMDFGVTLVVHLLRSPYEKVETLTRVLFKRLKTQEIDELEGFNRTNYWRFVDAILIRLYQEDDLKKACDVAKTASKLYFERVEKIEERKKVLIGEKYLKYMVNCILFAIATPKNYYFLVVVGVLMNKSYLDKENYKKLLAFFEVELKEKTKEAEAQLHKGPELRDQSVEEDKIRDDGASDVDVLVKAKPESEATDEQNKSLNVEEDGGPETLVKAKPIENEEEQRKSDQGSEKKMVGEKEKDQFEEQAKEDIEPGKNLYLDRFRQHMCRITGLKYRKNQTTAKKSVREKRATSAKKEIRKRQREDKDEDENQENDKEEAHKDQTDVEEKEPEAKAEQNLENEREDQKEDDEDNLSEIKMDKKEIEASDKKKSKAKEREKKVIKIQQKTTEPATKPKSQKKRKEREYNDMDARKDTKEEAEVKEMVQGKQQNKRTKHTKK